MPKKIARTLVIRSYQLRQAGLTLTRIMEKLREEFDEDDVPNESTISRHLKKFADGIPPEELAEDVPFQWGTMSGVPWEGSANLLQISVGYNRNRELDHQRPFTRRLAKWTWRVIQAFGGPIADDEEPEWGQNDVMDDVFLFLYDSLAAATKGGSVPYSGDVLLVAQEYAWREIAQVTLGEPLDTTDLDLWLGSTPWKGPGWLERYRRAKDRLGIRRVAFHNDDVDWVARIDPRSASLIRRLDSLPEIPMFALPEAVMDEPRTLLLEETDGLLESQVMIYAYWRRTEHVNNKSPGSREPWYFDLVDSARQRIRDEYPNVPDLGVSYEQTREMMNALEPVDITWDPKDLDKEFDHER